MFPLFTENKFHKCYKFYLIMIMFALSNKKQMRTIDLKAIIEAKELDADIVAAHLFPTNQYPKLAMKRVLEGKSLLDATQIAKLSIMSGLSVNEIFSGANWEAKSSDGKHKFTNGVFTAELDTETWITKIFHNDSMVQESVIHSKNVPLSEYLKALTIITLKINKNEKN